jgi:hypothetical protein
VNAHTRLTVRELDALGLSISRLEEQSSRRWLGREGAGGESLPDRGWLADPQPTDTEER